MSSRDDLKRNGSGAIDNTAEEAIKNVDSESVRFHKMLKGIFRICRFYGFHLEERIVVKDMRTGHIWR